MLYELNKSFVNNNDTFCSNSVLFVIDSRKIA